KAAPVAIVIQNSRWRPVQTRRRDAMTATAKTGGGRRAALPIRSRARSVVIAETASAYPNAYRTPTRPQFMRSQIGRTDLGALQASAEVDVHRLPFREDVERRGSSFGVSVARRFRPAEREMHF